MHTLHTIKVNHKEAAVRHWGVFGASLHPRNESFHCCDLHEMVR